MTALLHSAIVMVLAWSHAAASGKLAYPATPRDSVVDDYHGTQVADPYRGSRISTVRAPPSGCEARASWPATILQVAPSVRR